MPIKYEIYTPDVINLLDQARCAHTDVDATRFDVDHWTKDAKATIQFYCMTCPAITVCADVVMGPAKHGGYSGIAGGHVWRNGKKVRFPGRRRATETPDEQVS